MKRRIFTLISMAKQTLFSSFQLISGSFDACTWNEHITIYISAISLILKRIYGKHVKILLLLVKIVLTLKWRNIIMEQFIKRRTCMFPCKGALVMREFPKSVALGCV